MRANANLDALDAGDAAVLRASLPRFGALEQLAISSPELTSDQNDGLQRIADDERRALRAYFDRFADQGLRDLATLACSTDTGTDCIAHVQHAMTCVAENSCVYERRDSGPFGRAAERACGRSRTTRSSPNGFGAELATGWQDSAFPNERRAWGYGLELRRRLGQRIGAMLRLDRSNGRDAGIDTDGDGRDDVATGRVSRITALAGFSVIPLTPTWDGIWHYLELDILAGYTSMTSPGDEDGFTAGADLSFQLAGTRFGLRALQGFGEASEARSVLAHIGFSAGSAPQYTYVVGCSADEPGLGFSFGFDFPLSGYSLGTGIGYSPPFGGIGLEIAYILSEYFQPLARADVLVFLNGDADHVLHHAVMAGGRIDLAPLLDTGKASRAGPFVTLLAGYAWGAVTQPSKAGSGPVGDASLGWLFEENDVAAWVRLHGRFGLVSDNEDLRALFLSVGFERRFNPDRWDWR